MRRRGGVSAFFMVAEGRAKVFQLQGFTGRLTFCTLRAGNGVQVTTAPVLDPPTLLRLPFELPFSKLGSAQTVASDVACVQPE